MNQDNNYNNVFNSQSPYMDNRGTDKPPKKNKSKLVISLILLVVVIVIAVIAVKFIVGSNHDLVAVSSTFEKVDDHWVLKADDGKILLDNIKQFGGIYTDEFCNGTIKVMMIDGKVGIIDGRGNFIVAPGEYDYIDQEGCYYKVTNYDDPIRVKILKSDGSLFFQDENDVYLNKSHIDCAINYCFSNKVALFTTYDKYQLLDSRGNVIKEYTKIKNISEPKVSGKYQNEDNARYITSYYNGTTDVFDTNNNKMLASLKGKYYVKDINPDNEQQFILFKSDNNDQHMIAFNNGKRTFEETACLNVRFGDDKIMCLIQNGGVYKYFDIYGKEVAK